MIKKLLASALAALAFIGGAAEAQVPRTVKREAIDQRVPNTGAATLMVATGTGPITPSAATNIIDVTGGSTLTVNNVVLTNVQNGDTIKVGVASGDAVTFDHGAGNVTTSSGLDIVIDAVGEFVFLDVTASGVVVRPAAGGSAPTIPNAVDGDALVLSSDAATPTRAAHILQAQSGTTDALKTITASAFSTLGSGVFIIDAGDTITVDETANITIVGSATELELTGGDVLGWRRDAAGTGVTAWKEGAGSGSEFPQVIFASDYGVTCDYNTGTLAGTNNTAAMRSLDTAIEAAKSATVIFDYGTTGNCLVYEAGDTDAALWDLSSAVKSLKIVTNGVVFHTEKDWTSTQASALIIRSISDLTVDGRLEVYNGETPASEPDFQFGVRFLNFLGPVGKASAQVKCTGGVQCVRVTRLADGSQPLSTNKASNLNFDIETDRTFYPLSLENNGFGVTARIKSNRAGRSIIGYNGEDWDVYVNSTNPQTTNDALFECASVSNDNPKLRNIRVRYHGQPKPSENGEGGGVWFGVQGTVPCESSGLDVEAYQDDDATNKLPFIFGLFKQSSSGVTDDTASRGHKWHFTNLVVNGTAVGAYEVFSLGGGSGYTNGNFTGEDIRVDNLVINLAGSSSSSLRFLDSATFIGGGSIVAPGTVTGLTALKDGSHIGRVDTSAYDVENIVFSGGSGIEIQSISGGGGGGGSADPLVFANSVFFDLDADKTDWDPTDQVGGTTTLDDATRLTLGGGSVQRTINSIVRPNIGHVLMATHVTGSASVIFKHNGTGSAGNKFYHSNGLDLVLTGNETATYVNDGNFWRLVAYTGGYAPTFNNVVVSGQSTVVADTPADSLTLAAGSNITLTTNAGTDTVTIASSGGGSTDADDINVADAGGYYTGTQVEAVLQELGAAGVGAVEAVGSNRTYYVRTDGSDSNNGLTDSSGGAFLTIGKAVSTVYTKLIASGVTITIKVGGSESGAKTFNEDVVLRGPWLGSGSVVIEGDTTTPSNRVINCQTGAAIDAGRGARIEVKGIKFTKAGTCSRAISAFGSRVDITGNVDFGAFASGYHMYSVNGGDIDVRVSYLISGAATYHLYSFGGHITLVGGTVTSSGSPAFTTFAEALGAGTIQAAATTYSGTVTGKRYNATLNGVINSNGGGANYFPGDVAGTTATGGQYGS